MAVDKKRKTAVKADDGFFEEDPFAATEKKPKKKAAKKKTVKKEAPKASAAGKSAKGKGGKKKKKAGSWWALPVTLVMLAVLAFLGVAALHEKQQYEEFVVMREAVDVSGFYPGITIDGRNVAGRSLNDVMSELAAQDQAARDGLNATLKCGNRTWSISAEELGYASDYADIARQAWQLGHEGSIQERYRAIVQLRQGGAHFAVTRGYDQTLLRAITDAAAADLSYPAQDAQVASFDTDTLSFSFTAEQDGRAVDAEQLYQNALAALESGAGGQAVEITQRVVKPGVTAEELAARMGKVSEAVTHVSGNRNRRSNIQTALNTLNGHRVEPGEIFSFNGAVGERTEERGYKMAGAFLDGLKTEELGGGICQVSTTLFNAIAKANLELKARSPHSRPVAYVDKGKDAAVSWPNQDFKFMNSTPYPVYIVTYYDEDSRDCTIAIYGQLLEGGKYITIEAETLEEYEPGDPTYIYTRSLATGQKELVEEARTGYYAESYKVWHSADGTVLERTLYCRSTYLASGAIYNVGE